MVWDLGTLLDLTSKVVVRELGGERIGNEECSQTYPHADVKQRPDGDGEQ